MVEDERYKTYPQRCSVCDRIGYMEDISADEWTCKYCGTLNKYIPNSRFFSTVNYHMLNVCVGIKYQLLTISKEK